MASERAVLPLHAVRDDVGVPAGPSTDGVDRSQFLDGVLDTVSVGIVACDADGRLTLFNEAARAFHGSDFDPTLPPER